MLEGVKYALRYLTGSFAIGAYIQQSSDWLVLARNYLGLHIGIITVGEYQALLWSSEKFPSIVDIGNTLEEKVYISIVEKELDVDTAFIISMKYLTSDSLRIDQLTFETMMLENTFSIAKPVNDKIADSAVVVFSGGMDSTVAATIACQTFNRVHLLHFKYGCKAQKREIQACRDVMEALKRDYPKVEIELKFSDLSYLKDLGGSTLTDKSGVIADGKKGAETDNEWVPARNLVMMSMAAAYCDRHEIGNIILGLNREESSVYCLTDHENNIVRMKDGSFKHITKIKVGDKLLAWDEENFKLTSTTVTKLHSKNSKEVYSFSTNSGRKWKNPIKVKAPTVRVKNQHGSFGVREVPAHTKGIRVEQDKTYEATGDHNFYFKNKGWMKLKDAKIGDIILHKGDMVTKERMTYNNYFAGVDRSGKNNPMHGHIRHLTKKCHCGKAPPPHTSEVASEAAFKAHEDDPTLRDRISKGVRNYLKTQTPEQKLFHARRVSEGAIKAQKARKKRTGYHHHMQNPKYKKILRKSMADLIDRGIINPATMNDIPSPNKLEVAFINRFKKEGINFKFVGDGQIWLTSRKGKKMNPDFIDLKNRRIIEVTSGDNYWHHPQNMRRRREAYEQLGWSCVYLTSKDLRVSSVKTYVEQKFGGLDNGLVITKKRKLPKERKVYDITCEPHHNYFLGKQGMLTHNSDNSSEFYERLDKVLPIATHSKPKISMPLGNMMKHHIYSVGRDIKAPLDDSWSCYHGGKTRCGKCGPCFYRLKSAMMHGKPDTVKYADYPKWYSEWASAF